MKKEILILLLYWLICIFLLIKFVPKEKRRLAHITFLFVQAITWIYEFLQVIFGMLEFPFREFPSATKMSFSLYYLVAPTIEVFFILLYPIGKTKLRVFIHYLIFAMGVPTFTFVNEKYTLLFHFKKWNFFMTILFNLIMLYIVKKFVFWFKKGLI